MEPEAARSFQTSIDLYESRSELGKAAGVLRDWGDSLTDAKRYEAALAKYQKALEYVRRIPDPAGEARMVYDIGMAHSQLKDFSSAESDFRQALTLAGQVRDEWTQALAANSLAYAEKDRGDIAAGIRDLDIAAAHCKAAGDRDLSSVICRNISESLDLFAKQLSRQAKSGH
jgi:tetratricopeptide (TPR) repeat protein